MLDYDDNRPHSRNSLCPLVHKKSRASLRPSGYALTRLELGVSRGGHLLFFPKNCLSGGVFALKGLNAKAQGATLGVGVR